MRKIIHRIPFLRLTAALAAGILSGSVLNIDCYYFTIFLPALACLLLWINANYKFNLDVVYGVGVHLFFISTGIYLYHHYNNKPQLYSNGIFTATVKEILQEKPNSYQSVLKLNTFFRNDSVFSAREKVLVYFEKDSESQILEPGQVIIFNLSPQELKHNNNPFEFNYRKYMTRRQIYRQVYLSSQSWKFLSQPASFCLSVYAERVRMRLLDIYYMQNWEERQLQVISALTLGYRRGLDPETKRIFASAGVMHILAVSGLHAGILFMILNVLFGFLRKFGRGRILFVILVVLSLWGFAILTGLSPSVNRAAAMFTFVVIGQNLRRQLNIYNTLAASAFFLLLVNPNNLYEPGFQLSYAAVFGIVFLHPRIEKLFYFRLKIFRYFWSLLTLSVAAQIATFPVSVFYFHQFPVYFWLSNLVAIPAVSVLIPLGIAMLAFNWVPLLPALISDAAGLGLNILIKFPEAVERLPFSTVTIHYSPLELALILAFLISIFVFIERTDKIYFKTSLVLLFLFLTVSLGINTRNKFRNEIIVYNYTKQHVVHLISGRKNYVVSEEPLNETDNIHSLINNTVNGLQMNTPVYLICRELFNDSVLYLNNGFIFFSGKVLHFCHSGNQYMISPFEPDIIVCNQAKGKIASGKCSAKSFVAKSGVNTPEPVIISGRGENVAFRKKM